MSSAQEERERIEEAFTALEDVSCVNFVEMDNDEAVAHIRIFKGNGCSAHVGRQSIDSYQKLTLARGCLKKGIIMHELLHALGFFHMQSTYNRDDYVLVNTDNIKPSFRFNFDKYLNTEVSLFGTPYDIDSIMHYGRKFFSMNGLNTIETRDPEDIDRLGQRKILSDGDVERLNRMYKCS